jgi:DNA replication and repair protein RecF
VLLTEIFLRNIRAYEYASVRIPAGLSVLYGPNGSGKTTILESIHLLSTLRSFRTSRLADLVRTGKNEGLVLGKGEKPNGEWEIVLTAQSRKLRKQGKPVTGPKFLGELLCVALAPEHRALLTDRGEERRRFLDRILFGQDPGYLQTVLRYQRALRHKRALLKGNLPFSQYAEQVAPWNEELAKWGTSIRRSRLGLAEHIDPVFEESFERIAGGRGTARLRYLVPEEDLAATFEKMGPREHAATRSLAGPHRDGIEIRLNDRPVEEVASQGEGSSILLSLKWAELFNVERARGTSPILLLDDVGATLDEDRRMRLFSLLKDGKHQTLIATADAAILESAKVAGAHEFCRKNEDLDGGFSVAKWGVP